MSEPFSARWPFIRTCQECGWQGIFKDPATYSSDKWRDVKCRKCKSESLDFGSRQPWTDAQKAELEAYEKATGEYD